ncbi:adenylyl-sulfate kinase [Labilibaculum sp. A4]|uniref:adenylyl-sulfate kinase n=1 Tax=Labilibaculum euxinus TaxID=2686357 RepID=UPI000F624B13|nr:adenylyl-sulfate kinase [Labilibaculum euxinus]MDQ1769293.1 adenylyl-sulfate kinase [Labilibaculum euxinus]MWN74817.1 adenylyl-sulfate kinase [Labilibaculum euxinus]
MKKATNIFPIFEKTVPRAYKESVLNQRAKAVWFTGLSGSEKSTIAIELEKELFKLGYFSNILDGDNIRSGITQNLGFSDNDRLENIRRISEISKLFVESGIITINCFISPTEDVRDLAKNIIGDDFIEVFIDTPLHICEQRDIKELYKRARNGDVKNFPGINSPFISPKNPDIVIKTEDRSVKELAEEILEHIIDKIIEKRY